MCLQGIVDRIGGVVGVWDEEGVQEALEATGVRVPVRTMGMVMPVVARGVPVIMGVLMSVGCAIMRGVGGRVHGSLRSAWWWRGCPPSECSAWKIASETSWEACSFSSR